MFCKSVRNPISSVNALFISCFCDSVGKVSRRFCSPLKNPSGSKPADFFDLNIIIMMKPLQEDSGYVLILLSRGGPPRIRSVTCPDGQPSFRRLTVTNHLRGVRWEALAIEFAANFRHLLIE